MKLLSIVLFTNLLPLVLAGGHDSDSGCCQFTLSSAGPFSCPAGQLQDGQIRLNGTEPASTFCIDTGGRITDQNGFGCIVTDPPTTQVQCDQGASPMPGFSIGPDNTLQLNGSSSFFACPATDTEWNIYVSPNFGQLKCVPITLQADGCGSQTTTTCPVAPPSTIYQTQWMTQLTTQYVTQQNNNTVTMTETTTAINTAKETKTETKTETQTETETKTDTQTDTVTQPCTSSKTTTKCNKCTRKSTTSYSNTTSICTSSTLGWNTTTGWNVTTTTCHKCVGTGTGAWTTMETATMTTGTDSTTSTTTPVDATATGLF